MSVKNNENTTDIRKKILESALFLSAEKGWEYVGLRDIAAHAGISFANLRDEIDDKSDLLVLLGKVIDRRVLENISGNAEDSSVRERLFDLLMDRFDALNDYRAGVVSVIESLKYDPKQTVICMPHICKSMAWMLEGAGVETYGARGAVKVLGLSGVYLKVLHVWVQDDSADLSKTMAALDKALGRAENWAETFGF